MCGERDCLNHCVECGDPTCRECIAKNPIPLIDEEDDVLNFTIVSVNRVMIN